MKNLVAATDGNPFTRWLLIPYIIRLRGLAQSKSTQSPQFSLPRFDPFRPIVYKQSSLVNRQTNQNKRKGLRLLYALIRAHQFEIMIGFLTCLLWALFNALTPRIMKEFFRLMKDTQLEGRQIERANYLTELFVVLQILRIILSANTRRLFGQLSIKVSGALSIQLAQKALRISHNCRQILPEAEIFQLQNTDMKAVNKLFKELWVLADIPFTILAAVVLLFMQSVSFGIVGFYWICLFIFFQRWLYDLMDQSVNRKLKLTQMRSRSNYELVSKMTIARLDMSQDYLIESNNDFFLKEFEEYQIFHRLEGVFDMSLIIMPLVIVISIAFYDVNQKQSFTIEEVYMLMSLIALVYKPLKNIKKYSLIFSEGVYSLKRFALYLNLPEDSGSTYIKNDPELAPKLTILQNTTTFQLIGPKQRSGCLFGQQINMYFGQRFWILGQNLEELSHVVQSIVGQVKTVSGGIIVEGSLAYLPRKNCFSGESIAQNIAFYDKTIAEVQIEKIYRRLGLGQDFQLREGMSEKMKIKNYTETELRKIGLARVLCSHRKLMVLDCPFEQLSGAAGQALQMMLRQRQAEGALVIIASSTVKYPRGQDKIAFIKDGITQEFGSYESLLVNSSSMLHQFRKRKSFILSDRITTFNILKQFQRNIRKFVETHGLTEQEEEQRIGQKQFQLNILFRAVGRYTLKMSAHADSKLNQKKTKQKPSYMAYAIHVVKYIPLSDWIWTILMILVIQLLNIFIQYQFGNEYKHGGKEKLSTLRGIMRFQIILAICLAGLLFLSKEIEYCISYILANHIYKHSLEGMTKKKMSWYMSSSAHLIAHKYNHDYDQICTFVKYILDIIKFTIVLITTIISINATARIVFILTFVTFGFEYFLFSFFKRSQDTLVRCYPIYKHSFVNVFDQVVEGAHMIKIYDKEAEAINKAKVGFVNLAAYKLTSQTVQITADAVSQFAGTFIIALGLELGTKAKLKAGDQNEALIAVSVFMLFNLSNVLKTMMKTILKLTTFFRLKMLTTIELMKLKPQQEQNITKRPLRHILKFNQTIVQNPQDPLFQIYPLTLTFSQDQKVLILQKDAIVRRNLLMLLTNNFQDNNHLNKRRQVDIITIGGLLLKDISKNDLRFLVGTLLDDNFFFSGTLRQNLQWKAFRFNQSQVLRLARLVNLSKELPQFKQKGIDVHIRGDISNILLGRKLAILKIMLRRPKIVIIKDTSWMVGDKNILQLLKSNHIHCTVIGISDVPHGVCETDRIILMERAKVLEQDLLSQAGELLRLHKNDPYNLHESSFQINRLNEEKSKQELIRTIIETHVERDLQYL